MKVHFYATLRHIAGRKTVEFDLPAGATVQALIDAIVDRFPEMRDRLLDEDGELYSHVHVFINGRDASYLDESLDTPLGADDKIDVFPAVGGG